jgi:hypothetical protein
MKSCSNYVISKTSFPLDDPLMLAINFVETELKNGFNGYTTFKIDILIFVLNGLKKLKLNLFSFFVFF